MTRRAPLLVLLLAVTACGHTGHAASSSTPRSSARYLAQVSAIDHSVADARSDVFHSPRRPAALLANMARLRTALATAEARLRRLHPPPKLAALHSQLLADYRTTADQAARELGRRRPRRGRLTAWYERESQTAGRLVGAMYAAP